MRIRDALTGSLLPSADAEVLLARSLGVDRTWLLAHPDDTLSDDSWRKFSAWIERRRKFEPVAYITGEQEFFGRPFMVDKRVLIPRPSTEGLVETALEFLRTGHDVSVEVDTDIVAVARRTAAGEWTPPKTIIDIGTGSGAIVVTLALERPDLEIIATDVSQDALDVAHENAKRHGVDQRITFLQGDGLEPLDALDLHEPFIFVSNPPYIPLNRTLMPDVINFEPHVALFGGEDGSILVRTIIEGATSHPLCRGYVMEFGKEQI